MFAHAQPDAVVLLGWTLQPLLLAGMAFAVAAWALAVHAVNAAHPTAHVPVMRSVAFGAGLLALLVALVSPIDAFADDLFSVHMLQHLLIAFVAAPLLVLAAPGTLLLRISSTAVRRRLVLPVLHGRIVRWLTFPAFTWLLFGLVMWLAHFTPLFELALESPTVHDLEHLAFLVAGFLYWLPAIGSEPIPWRLGISGRLLYLVLGMPVSSILGLVIVAQTSVMYPHYAGAGALADQRLAGSVMWVGGDLLTVAIIGVAGWLWVRREGAREQRRQGTAPHSG